MEGIVKMTDRVGDQSNIGPAARDLRLDLFRGAANWAIFLDHIPNNVVAWITMKHYGFQ